MQRSKFSIILSIFLGVLIILGIGFRFSKTYSQVMTDDERVTAMRIAGNSWRTDKDFFYENALYNSKTLKDYHELNNNSTFKDTINSLYREDTQHPPLYYLLGRWAAKLGDKTFYSARYISILASCLSVVSIYFLTKEIFDLPFIGIISSCLLALSQNQIAIANHARPFSLYIFLTIFSIWIFIKILNGNKSIYLKIVHSVTITLSLYSLPLTILTIIGKGIYLVVKDKNQLKWFCLSCLASFTLYYPWLSQIIKNRELIAGTTNWTNKSISFTSYLEGASRIITNSLVYSDLVDKSLVIILFSISLVVSYRYSKNFLILLTIGLSNYLPFLLSDLVKGGVKVLQGRYILPFQILLLVALSCMIASLISKNRTLGIFFLSLVLTFQLSSSIKYIRSESWYTDSRTRDIFSIVKYLKPNDTLLINLKKAYPNKNYILSLSYQFKDNLNFLLYKKLTDENLSRADYLFNPSKEDLQNSKRFNLKRLESKDNIVLYSITPK